MNEFSIDEYKKTIEIYTEIRDTTKDISKICDKALKLLSPISMAIIGADKWEKEMNNCMLGITVKFGSLDNYIQTITSEGGNKNE